ncbi:thioredoxin family protein [Bradyrhizobium ontarionense]|uniref:Thioredoxin family protein n=1 Tax=Bradyrhizobium ontarionense TaxID=2898149 RepID=A0ABY3RIU9_9BRAD|nr:thioredoxin family protein [Bradyrhizobium sp. A19]UFZ07281.1 thioredoxin family protein [Bradyrhizobium sp. A19]
MTIPRIVSQADWTEAHRAHLAKEKAFIRERDALAAARRALPWVRVEKDYVFQTPKGPLSLGGLFQGRSQLIIYHFMMTPGDSHRCPGCSFLCDHIDGANQHLRHHDVSLVVVSRAPLAEIAPFKARMGWSFDWVSSEDNDFNFDYQVSFSDEQIVTGRANYNFAPMTGKSPDLPGVTVFYKSEAGDIFCTFQVRARGGDPLIGAYHYLDLTPNGRNETKRGMMSDWVRLHDEYDERGNRACHCGS